jgi:hypothetical protein
MMTYPPMRPQLEIQFQHDMLMTLLSDSRLLQAVVPEEYHASLAMATDCLCWVLHHDVDSHPHSHASDFAQCLKDIKEGLAAVGFTWEPPPDHEYVVEG